MKDQNPPSTSPFLSIRTIDYTVILVRDMAAMRRFYEGILCFPLTRELSAGWIEYQIGGNTLALSRPGRTAKDAPTPKAARPCSSRSGLHHRAPTSWCGTASICSSRRRTSPSAIARCSSGIPMETCWRCMRRFDGR